MRICNNFLATAIGLAVLVSPLHAQSNAKPAAAYTPEVGQAGKDVIWVPTSQALVNRMLDMAKLTPQDILVDLGSGDGRTVITAAKRGAMARGIEFNPDLVAMSQRAAAAEGVAARARFEHADIFKSQFSDATVVTLFLLPSLNERLRPILLDMRPGTRVVANSFRMGDWEPDLTSHVADGCTSYCEAHLWIVPAKVAGTWTLDGKPLQFTQTYQRIDGALRDGARTTHLNDSRIDGANISFSIGNTQYMGVVDGNQMRGTTAGGVPWIAQRVEVK
ncbi:methyltransferase domain-containing protein [Uliginosibacterium sp. H1]|uniref:methyltransferase domain-containing protein n=1 Tax=Uliginosibacterium sp. H1 TaxID=3114757 RepID=UPI002E18FE24|nr:methyltransferase domain-containing protein [Uliginosibacterium sp. H1]